LSGIPPTKNKAWINPWLICSTINSICITALCGLNGPRVPISIPVGYPVSKYPKVRPNHDASSLLVSRHGCILDPVVDRVDRPSRSKYCQVESIVSRRTYYFNYATGGTNAPPVLAFVPPALVICPIILD